MQTILLVHVGPVQDFIASARRCRDLWFGSQLLSQVSRQAAEAMLDAANTNASEALIFPGELTDQSSVANKIQLVLTTSDDTRIREVAEAGRAAIQSYLQENARSVFEKISSEDFEKDRALDQIKSMMEYMWVALKSSQDLTKNNNEYKRLRSQAEAMLAARKNTRNWDKMPGDDAKIPKSSLDGVRPSVMGKGTRQKYDAHRLYREFKARPGEQLCGVGLFKRLGQFTLDGKLTREDASEEVPVFHSTSHIASMPTLCRLSSVPDFQAVEGRFLEALQHDNALGKHPKTLKEMRIRLDEEDDLTYTCFDPRHEQRGQHFSARRVLNLPVSLEDGDKVGLDGVLFYSSRVEASGPSSILASIPDDDAKRKDQVKQSLLNAQQKFLSTVHEGTSSEPCAYYALLLADGDKMGVAIDALGSLEKHRNLSKVLDQRFAQRCKKCVKDHGGTLIYAGGDDVLAMLPLHTALACSRALKDLFASAMNEVFESEPNISDPTLSVGLAIAHHLEPLGEVRELAKQAEKLAKSRGRNSLAIALAKRGQKPLLAVGKWNEAPLALDARLNQWARYMEQEIIPGRLAYRLLDVIAPLEVDMQSDQVDSCTLENLCKRLVVQVLDRRNLDDEALIASLEGLYDNALNSLKENGILNDTQRGRQLPTPIAAVHHMSSELRIAEEFNRAYNLAFGRLRNAPQGGHSNE